MSVRLYESSLGSLARLNGAPQLGDEGVIGSHLFDAIPGVLKRFYRHAIQEVRNKQEIWDRLYECSSPEQFRRYRMRIHLIAGRSWLLVTNTLVSQRPQKKPLTSQPNIYLRDGIILLCAHCRCSKRIDGSNQWDFVPEHLRLKGIALKHVSHGLCPICRAYFYPY